MDVKCDHCGAILFTETNMRCATPGCPAGVLGTTFTVADPETLTVTTYERRIVKSSSGAFAYYWSTRQE